MPAALLLAQAQAKWERILDLVGKRNPGARALLAGSRAARLEHGRLYIDIPPQMSMVMEMVFSPSGYRPLLEQAVYEVLQTRLGVEGFLGPPRPAAAKPAQETPPPAASPEASPDDEAPPDAEQSSLF